MEIISSSRSWRDFETKLKELGAERRVEKGQAFEELTRLHLLTDPAFATKLTDVWHHTAVPQRIADELGLQRPEIGVDLIARTKDGSFWAIQCKFHQDRSQNVTYDELKTFLSITERRQTYERLSHRLVCTSADGVSERVQAAHTHKLGYLTAADFSALGPEEFRRFRELLAGQKPTFRPASPRPHQQRAIENAIKHFKDGGQTRGKLIHPCGSGKSLSAYWISEALSPKHVLIAVPSLSLVRQTLGTWTREALARAHDMEWLAVCSDEDVSRSDDPAMRSVDLGIDVSTDPAAVASFLSKPSPAVKVVMTTYQSGRVVGEGAEMAKTSFDLGIFDEAHKTVGSEGRLFAHLLSDKNIPIARRVFMTATERQYRGNSDDILSMDDASVYGEVFDQLSFKAALELDPPILSDYRIISIVVTKSEIEQLIKEQTFVRTDGKEWSLEADAPTFASLVALRKSIEKYGIHHTVSFHRSIRRAKEFTELNGEASKADPTLGSIHSFHVSGDVSTGKRAAIIDRFVDAVPSLITNARCLTEGVDVPAIDAVLFADPRQSKIDIVQAAGRAMRRFEGKKLGYIIVPVMIDEESDDPSDDAFDQIIAVLSALAMEDERIVEEFRSIASEERTGGTNIVEIDVPEYIRVEFGDLIANIETRIWDRLGFGWELAFAKLLRFQEENGHCRVSGEYRTEDGFRLGSWVTNQRSRKDRVGTDRRLRLEALSGWTWSVLEDRWTRGLHHIKAFAEREGHARVPQEYAVSDGFRLGRWVRTQRRRKEIMDPVRRQTLETLPDWSWHTLADQWEEGFSHLKEFSDREGHCRVPPRRICEDGYRLGQWVGVQRATRDKLSSDRRQRLEALPGWTWDAYADQWEEGFSRLKEFSGREGHCRVPIAYRTDDGYRLGQWVGGQRDKRNKSSADRRQRLDALPGWSWAIRSDRWEEGFSYLKEFADREGHCRVPQELVTESGFNLGNWVATQRSRNEVTDPERRQRLDALPGWSWAIRSDRWEEGFSYLKEFADREGHCRVPRELVTESGFNLGKWVVTQRSRNEVTDPERRQRLDALPGWSWAIRSDRWEEGFSYLKEFADREGHCRVPQRLVTDSGFNLGRWVNKQRGKGSTLDTSRQRRLESLRGWSWDLLSDRWRDAISYLASFAHKEGHCHVPRKFATEDGFELGGWVAKQRANKDTMDPIRRQQLEALPGWSRHTLADQWEEGFSHLKEFSDREGHSRVPQRFRTIDGYGLGQWVSVQRSRKGYTDPERRRRLEGLRGWTWDARSERWEEGFSHLKEFSDREGHCRVSRNYITGDGYRLGEWVSRQKQFKDQMVADRKSRLEILPGWVWSE